MGPVQLRKRLPELSLSRPWTSVPFLLYPSLLLTRVVVYRWICYGGIHSSWYGRPHSFARRSGSLGEDGLSSMVLFFLHLLSKLPIFLFPHLLLTSGPRFYVIAKVLRRGWIQHSHHRHTTFKIPKDICNNTPIPGLKFCDMGRKTFSAQQA